MVSGTLNEGSSDWGDDLKLMWERNMIVVCIVFFSCGIDIGCILATRRRREAYGFAQYFFLYLFIYSLVGLRRQSGG